MNFKSSGVTLIELLVVLAIVGIAAVIGMPNLSYVISKVRMDGEINAVLSGLNLARSEAVKRGLTVSVCPSTDGTTCAAGTNWSSGWIVQLAGPPTQLLQTTAALSRDTLASTSAATPAYPQFTSMGYTFFNDTLKLHDTNDANDTQSLRRCIVFNAGSWVSRSGATCP
jgi:type IV fimbrial biogenesis protein FimT